MHNHAGIIREQIITEDEYRLFTELLEQRFGKMLKSGKMLSFHMKVSHRLAVLGMGTYREYYDYLVSDPEGMEAAVLMSHLANHESCFFRDEEQFRLLSTLLKEAAGSYQLKHKKSIRILSAASATGEEAYTLSSAVRSCGICRPAWDVKIIGIDIAPKAIVWAKEGRYGRDSFGTEVSDKNFRTENFTADGERYMVKPCLRENVEFRFGNLVDAKSLAGLGTMDMIFCRHILGSMTDSGIQRAVRNLFSLLSDEGYLFIGTSESIIQHTNLFVPMRTGAMTVYRKNICREPRLAGMCSMDVLQQEAR
ncbi:MAG: methyltransferase domain-containing protein [Nitrospirae bacterium]|nr:methyltransferase domain-containing protein [Nitrospirota bacterium]